MLKIFLFDTVDFDQKNQKYYENFLSFDERKRFDEIKPLETKTNFLVGRIIARTELAKILNCTPQEIIFSQNQNGRLEISLPLTTPISFNISHSKNLVAVAISKYKVGIDVEFLGQKDFVKIADYLFSKEEANAVKNCDSDDEKQKIFYHYWTLYEAFIKCNGASIFDKKPQFFLNEKDPKIKSSADENYQFLNFKIKDGYCLALALNVNKSEFCAEENCELTFTQNLDYQNEKNLS